MSDRSIICEITEPKPDEWACHTHKVRWKKGIGTPPSCKRTTWKLMNVAVKPENVGIQPTTVSIY